MKHLLRVWFAWWLLLAAGPAAAQTLGPRQLRAGLVAWLQLEETTGPRATGKIAPTVPLLTLPGVAGGVALGLQYTAGSGIKVNEVASEVGPGWTLWRPSIAPCASGAAYWSVNPARLAKVYTCTRLELKL